MGNLVDEIKNDAKRSGASKKDFIFFKEGVKTRIRFLEDADEGRKVTFHDSYERGINVPCQEIFGKDCPFCGDDDLRTRSLYAWSVYNYETNSVQILMFAVNNCSPVPAIIAAYENFGTLLDRDYVISVTGKQQNKVYTVMPQDKNKFRNTKAKAFSESKFLRKLAEAFPVDDEDDVEEDDEPVTRKKKKPAASSKKKKPEPEYDEDDEDDDDDYIEDDEEEEDDEEPDYSEMSAIELYRLCKKRKLEVLPRKSVKYYVKQLEEDDKAQDDWSDDDDEEDEWED